MTWLKVNWFKAGILAIALLAVTLSLSNASERDELERDNNLMNSISRDGCIRAAEEEFHDDFVLNSDEVSDGARRWHSRVVQENIEETLQREKDFCLKLYPTK